MSSKAIREVQSLGLIRKHLDVANAGGVELLNFAAVETEQDLETLPEQHPWINDTVRTIEIFRSFHTCVTILNRAGL